MGGEYSSDRKTANGRTRASKPPGSADGKKRHNDRFPRNANRVARQRTKGTEGISKKKRKKERFKTVFVICLH